MKDKSTQPQYARLEQTFGENAPHIHCPVCGQCTISVDDDNNARVNACAHFEFLYIGEIGEFEHRSERFQKRSQTVDLDELDLTSLPESLQSMGYGHELLALQITYGGMACGPVYYTDVYGFNFQADSAD